jgi:hypothetical protein
VDRLIADGDFGELVVFDFVKMPQAHGSLGASPMLRAPLEMRNSSTSPLHPM